VPAAQAPAQAAQVSMMPPMRCVPEAHVAHFELAEPVQVRPPAQLPIALQLVQTRLCPLVHDVAWYVPTPQVAAHATHVLPLK
jgi:hypothetical protein